MYYIYKKQKNNALPEFHYMFKKFKDFYDIAALLEVPLSGSYFINIKSDSYEDIMQFLKREQEFKHLVVYVEISETLLDYILLRKPNITLLDSKSNFEVFTELVTKHSILFQKGCLQVMYNAIGHSYQEMDEALKIIKNTYGEKEVTKDDISKLFVVDEFVYPRTVCIDYLLMSRYRRSRLKKCLEYFGNDLVFYAIRKNAIKFLEEKIKYLKTGKGNGLIKILDANNIIRMVNTLEYNNPGFKDIFILLDLYEKGVTVNDSLQRRTGSSTNEKRHSS